MFTATLQRKSSPTMATVTYVLDGVTIALDILEQLADFLPAPASKAFALAKVVIQIAEVCSETILHFISGVYTYIPTI